MVVIPVLMLAGCRALGLIGLNELPLALDDRHQCGVER